MEMNLVPITFKASLVMCCTSVFFFSSRRRHTRLQGDWSSDVCSSDLRCFISNARADALFSTKEGESEGKHRAVTLNNMLFSAALSKQAIDEAGAARRELLLVSPSGGADLLFELLSSVVQHPREGTCVVSILRNVTDPRAAPEQIEETSRLLKLAEADVRAERDRLDLIIDSVADPILVTDPSGKILLMNSPAERLFTAPTSDETTEAERAVRSNDAHFSSFVSNLFLT